MNPFKKAMGYLSYLVVRGKEGGGCDYFPRKVLLMHLLHPSACPGLLEVSQFDLIPHRALGLGQGIQGLDLSIYLPAQESSSYKIQYITEEKEIGR